MRLGWRTLGAVSAFVIAAVLAVPAIEALDRSPESKPDPGSWGKAPTPRSSRPLNSPRSDQTELRPPAIQWRDSRSLGDPANGSLIRGVMLPRGGPLFYTWDPVLRRRPNRAWRRWGNDDLVRITLGVIRGFGRAHPNAARIGIGDLSRPHGGEFGPRFGYIGHATHQNGLDVDVYYPRLDRRERPPDSPADVDMRLAQDLLDRFLRAGAVLVYVGPNLPLRGPPDRVAPIPLHDNHLHVRISG